MVILYMYNQIIIIPHVILNMLITFFVAFKMSSLNK